MRWKSMWWYADHASDTEIVQYALNKLHTDVEGKAFRGSGVITDHTRKDYARFAARLKKLIRVWETQA